MPRACRGLRHRNGISGSGVGLGGRGGRVLSNAVMFLHSKSRFYNGKEFEEGKSWRSGHLRPCFPTRAPRKAASSVDEGVQLVALCTSPPRCG